MPEMIMSMDLPLYGMAVLGTVGVLGMLTTHLSYRRTMRHTKKESRAFRSASAAAGTPYKGKEEKTGLKEKWMEIWKTRDRLLARMNRFVWYPSLLSAALLGLAIFLNSSQPGGDGLSLSYIYLGAAIPVVLLVFRQGLDFTYREALLVNALRDYVEEARKKEGQATVLQEDAEHVVNAHTISGQHPADSVEEALHKEAVIDHITESIRQTAAAGSHFRSMLTPEEEEIMREVIKEFME